LRIAVALGQENSARADEYLQLIERETQRLEDLIGQLLSSQASVPEFDTHIDLVSLLQQLCDDANFEGAEQGKRVALDCDIAEAIVASSGDLLHKSFDNILRNALRHTPPDGIISVALTRTGEHYRVTVTDRGGVVAENELEKIFDAFYRTDAARSRALGGHGLGLAIARRGILQHGGQISAANTGTGLAVTIGLPIQIH
jgi:signal transduction histidine kinase